MAARQRADRNTRVGVKHARFDIHEPGGVSGDCTDFVSGLDGINVCFCFSFLEVNIFFCP